ncbi:MAG: Rpn family recombination-promoting nuclease/putative transposase [Pseudanabaenaceae cyanobacterium bins.68]|nr:Rpn family recombination-promoting nuclease/putative transposase [Pseudanabaenaceae cyanobacterium bins.68]
MKTDKLFYRLFLAQPSLISELIPEIPIDCEFTYSAPAIKEKGFAIDGLLTPVREDSNLPIVFLEAQMQRDPQFYGRYFAEIFLYLYQYQIQKPWYGLLILPNRNQDIGSSIPYQSLLPSQVKQFYLEDLLELEDLSPNLALLKLITVPETDAVDLARSILKTADTEPEKRRRLDLVEAILVNKFPQLSTEEILKMLNLKTADIKETRFYQEVRLVGLEEGRQEGRQEEAANLVSRLLVLRCGSLPSDLELRVRSLSVNQLELLGEALLDFSEIGDLENWLAAMS